MAANPAGDWRISDVLKVAEHVGLIVREPNGGSHYTFASPYLENIETVPFKRPIKVVFIRKFVVFAKRHAKEEKANEGD